MAHSDSVTLLCPLFRRPPVRYSSPRYVNPVNYVVWCEVWWGSVNIKFWTKLWCGDNVKINPNLTLIWNLNIFGWPRAGFKCQWRSICMIQRSVVVTYIQAIYTTSNVKKHHTLQFGGCTWRHLSDFWIIRTSRHVIFTNLTSRKFWRHLQRVPRKICAVKALNKLSAHLGFFTHNINS